MTVTVNSAPVKAAQDNEQTSILVVVDDAAALQSLYEEAQRKVKELDKARKKAFATLEQRLGNDFPVTATQIHGAKHVLDLSPVRNETQVSDRDALRAKLEEEGMFPDLWAIPVGALKKVLDPQEYAKFTTTEPGKTRTFKAVLNSSENLD